MLFVFCSVLHFVVRTPLLWQPISIFTSMGLTPDTSRFMSAANLQSDTCSTPAATTTCCKPTRSTLPLTWMPEIKFGLLLPGIRSLTSQEVLLRGWVIWCCPLTENNDKRINMCATTYEIKKQNVSNVLWSLLERILLIV